MHQGHNLSTSFEVINIGAPSFSAAVCSFKMRFSKSLSNFMNIDDGKTRFYSPCTANCQNF